MKSQKYRNLVFTDFNDEQQLYWAGFLTGDGYLLKDKKWKTYSVQLKLSQKDKEHVRQFSKYISGTLSINQKKDSRTNQIYYYARSCLYNQNDCKNLIQFGVFDRKKLPTITSEKMRHFIRGYFDADGSIGIYGTNQQPRITFTNGTKELLECLQDFLSQELQSKSIFLYHPKANDFKLCIFQKKLIFNFYKYIYKDATIYLGRKKSIFNQLN